MKNIVTLLIFALILASCGEKKATKKEVVPVQKVEEVTKTEEVKEVPKPVVVFTVQIGATKRKSKLFSSVKDVQVFNENGMFKYRVGAFTSYKEAKAYKKQLQQKYSGVFIQAIKDNKPISIAAALK